MTSFFTSDTHFGHIKIVEYCKRPFRDWVEMDEVMIERWNARVRPSDHVYHLGDFSLCTDYELIKAYVRKLNGNKHLILGNHDAKREKGLVGFAEVKPYKEIKVNDQHIVLFHYAMKTWNRAHYGSWQLHGHSHGTLPRDFTMRQLDVGVDVWNFTPISFDEIQEEMKKHTFVPVDHHRPREVPREETEGS